MFRTSTRKIIALAFSAAFIIFTAYCIISNKQIPNSFSIITGSIVSYYFGKSTALDTPGKNAVGG